MRSGVRWRLSWMMLVWLLLSRGGYAAAQTSGDISAILIQLANEQRRAAGLPAFNPESALQQAARDQAAHMAAAATLTHTGADGNDLEARLRQSGYQGSGIEVLYAGTNGPEGVIAWWANAEFTQETLLNLIYQDIGVGQVTAADGWIYWSIILGSPTHRGISAPPASPTTTATSAPPAAATLTPTDDDQPLTTLITPTAPPPPVASPVPPEPTRPAARLNTLPSATWPPWPATFTSAPSRTPTPAVAVALVVTQAPDISRPTTSQAEAVALAPLPTATVVDAPPAAPQEALVTPQSARFDPIPLLVAALALVGAAGLIYIGSRPTPRQRDPFRR